MPGLVSSNILAIEHGERPDGTREDKRGPERREKVLIVISCWGLDPAQVNKVTTRIISESIVEWRDLAATHSCQY